MTQFAALHDVLENLINLHKALYTLAVQKKDVLIKGDIEALSAITQQEQKLIKALGAAESARIELVKQMFATRGLSIADATLLDLVKIVTDPEEKSRLQSYRDELTRIVSELRQANELNQQLLEQSLSFVNLTLDLLTDTPEDDFIYRKPTDPAGAAHLSRSFLNKKV